jgi:serine protease
MKRWLLSICFFLLCGWAVVTLTGLTTQGSFNSIVIDFREDAGKGKIIESLDQVTQSENRRPRLNSEFSEPDQIYVIDGDATLLRRMRRSSWAKYTEFIEPNYLYSLPEASPLQLAIDPGKDAPKKGTNANRPNDPLYPQQWNLHSIGVESAWSVTQGKGVTVAVIDTGIAKVPDLTDERFVDGYDFINDETNASDDQGHGTHIAGTIGQNTNNGYGVAGIAPAVSLMPLKVATAGGTATAADIGEAIRFAADKGADVINLSLAGTGYSHLIQQTIDYAHRKGVVMIAAAGNSNQNAVVYPARYRHVIAVAALEMSAKRASYSNFGAGVDLSAPGGLISAENSTGGIIQNTFDRKTKESLFSPYQGSSFAAAHVSGAVALIRSAYQPGKLEPDQIEEILAVAGRHQASDPLNEFGTGQLDLGAAIAMVQAKQLPQLNFWRWLNNQGYLGAYFWMDPDMLASSSRWVILAGAIGLALLFGLKYEVRWNGWFVLGLVLSSSGLFVLQGIYFYGAPQWLFRLFGSALLEVGTVAQGIPALDPISASVLLPLGLWVLLYRFATPKWFAIGAALGMVPGLIGQMWPAPEILNVTTGIGSQAFLAINAIAALGLSWGVLRRSPRLTRAAKLAARSVKQSAKQAAKNQSAKSRSPVQAVPVGKRPNHLKLVKGAGSSVKASVKASVETADDEDPTAST